MKHRFALTLVTAGALVTSMAFARPRISTQPAVTPSEAAGPLCGGPKGPDGPQPPKEPPKT